MVSYLTSILQDQISLAYMYKNGGKIAEMWILCRRIDLARSWRNPGTVQWFPNIVLIKQSNTHSVARSLGGPWTWWIGSAPVQMSGCCLGAALSWLRDGLFAGVGCSSLTLRFSWTVTLIILGLLYSCFPSNLSTTTQGTIVKLRGASSELCTLFIWPV